MRSVHHNGFGRRKNGAPPHVREGMELHVKAGIRSRCDCGRPSSRADSEFVGIFKSKTLSNRKTTGMANWSSGPTRLEIQIAQSIGPGIAPRQSARGPTDRTFHSNRQLQQTISMSSQTQYEHNTNAEWPTLWAGIQGENANKLQIHGISKLPNNSQRRSIACDGYSPPAEVCGVSAIHATH